VKQGVTLPVLAQVELAAVRPNGGAGGGEEELRLGAAVLPLRLRIDQAVVEFLQARALQTFLHCLAAIRRRLWVPMPLFVGWAAVPALLEDAPPASAATAFRPKIGVLVLTWDPLTAVTSKGQGAGAGLNLCFLPRSASVSSSRACCVRIETARG
jgi:hypothetical protein